MGKVIKCILTKSNYLITHEELKISDNSQLILAITRKFDYPYIKNINNYESQIEFLNGINKLLENNFNVSNLDLEAIHIYDMDKSILRRMKEIFIDEKVNLIQASLDEIIELEIENENEEEISDECYNLENIDTNIEENEFIKKRNKFFYNINLISQKNDKNIINKKIERIIKYR